MAIRVVLTNKAQQTTELANTSNLTNNDIQLSRLVYQYFRSLAKNKTILFDYDNGLIPKELVKILDSFSEIQEGIEVSTAMQKLDEYLGELGVDTDYFFNKDIISIEDWFNHTDPAAARQVIDTTNNVVIDIDGTNYNIMYKA